LCIAQFFLFMLEVDKLGNKRDLSNPHSLLHLSFVIAYFSEKD
jgi:hypothetical protein